MRPIILTTAIAAALLLDTSTATAAHNTRIIAGRGTIRAYLAPTTTTPQRTTVPSPIDNYIAHLGATTGRATAAKSILLPPTNLQTLPLTVTQSKTLHQK